MVLCTFQLLNAAMLEGKTQVFVCVCVRVEREREIELSFRRCVHYILFGVLNPGVMWWSISVGGGIGLSWSPDGWTLDQLPQQSPDALNFRSVDQPPCRSDLLHILYLSPHPSSLRRIPSLRLRQQVWEQSCQPEQGGTRVPVSPPVDEVKEV